MSIFYRPGLKARIQRRISLIAHSFYLDNNGDPAKSALICGAGRSGTTWLGELLNHDNRYRLIYEPFNREQVPICRGFLPRQYLRPNEVHPQYLGAAGTVFTGRVRSAWVDQYNRRMFVRERLIKDVRSTLMLKWIRNRFPSVPIVFIVRHSCAVAMSRTQLGWRTNLSDIFLAQPTLVADYLEPHLSLMQEASSPFTRHIIDWCVENIVPFSQLSSKDVLLVFYEKLLGDPESELRRVCSHIGRPFDDGSLDRLAKPSASTVHARPSRRKLARQGAGWRKSLSAGEIDFAYRAAKEFGLERLYTTDAEPDEQAAEALLSQEHAEPITLDPQSGTGSTEEAPSAAAFTKPR